MRTITKEIQINVYTPEEIWEELERWHNVKYLKDRVLVDGKIDMERIYNDTFLYGVGLGVCELQEYLDGWCNYFVDDFQEVFEQDNKLYVLSFLE